jgi:rhodanese-related sulfurtransferase
MSSGLPGIRSPHSAQSTVDARLPAARLRSKRRPSTVGGLAFSDVARRRARLGGKAAAADDEVEVGHLSRPRRASSRCSGGSIRGAVAGSWRESEPLPGDRPALVVCSHGGRSLLASRKLRAAGLDARSIEGGMTAYRRAGLPSEGPS